VTGETSQNWRLDGSFERLSSPCLVAFAAPDTCNRETGLVQKNRRPDGQVAISGNGRPYPWGIPLSFYGFPVIYMEYPWNIPTIMG